MSKEVFTCLFIQFKNILSSCAEDRALQLEDGYGVRSTPMMVFAVARCTGG